MEFHVIIPARYNSKRLPGKVLLEIDGKPMLQHVYEKAVASGAESVVIATDDKRIKEVAEQFGASVCLTSEGHETGTDRVAEAVEALAKFEPKEIVVNVQADLPMIPPDIIRQVAEDLNEYDNVNVSTLAQSIEDIQSIFDPNIAKVILNRRNYAMYFSRAPIPWDLERFEKKENISVSESGYFKHIGIYAFRVNFLKTVLEWSVCPLEKVEKLEQLRILWNGGRIHVCIVKKNVGQEVNTTQDLEKVRELMGGK